MEKKRFVDSSLLKLSSSNKYDSLVNRILEFLGLIGDWLNILASWNIVVWVWLDGYNSA